MADQEAGHLVPALPGAYSVTLDKSYMPLKPYFPQRAEKTKHQCSESVSGPVFDLVYELEWVFLPRNAFIPPLSDGVQWV